MESLSSFSVPGILGVEQPNNDLLLSIPLRRVKCLTDRLASVCAKCVTNSPCRIILAVMFLFIFVVNMCT